MATKRKPAKKKSAKRKPSALAGSPIIIDGGSVWLKFSGAEFVPPAGGNHKHKDATAQIDKIILSGSLNQIITVPGNPIRIRITLK
ncbi:MAG: hypothetical protein ACMG6H_02230 [Acidobacteriota bacterium]